MTSDSSHRLGSTLKTARSAKPVSLKYRPLQLVIKYGTETLLEDEKYKVLKEFASVYGIGPVTAQMLYARGCRTLGDAKKFYENPNNAAEPNSEDEENEYEDVNKRVPERWIEISLALKYDLSIK